MLENRLLDIIILYEGDDRLYELADLIIETDNFVNYELICRQFVLLLINKYNITADYMAVNGYDPEYFVDINMYELLRILSTKYIPKHYLNCVNLHLKELQFNIRMKIMSIKD